MAYSRSSKPTGVRHFGEASVPGGMRAVPQLSSYTLAFALQLSKNHGKTSVRVAEKCQLGTIHVVHRAAATDCHHESSRLTPRVHQVNPRSA